MAPGEGDRSPGAVVMSTQCAHSADCADCSTMIVLTRWPAVMATAQNMPRATTPPPLTQTGTVGGRAWGLIEP